MEPFISYLREDHQIIERLVKALVERGQKVLIDTSIIGAGPWNPQILKAIDECNFFIPCFTHSYFNRKETDMNEEIEHAILRTRKMQYMHGFIIPISLDGCEIPNIPIRVGQTLKDMECVDMSKDWENGLDRLLRLIQHDSYKFDNPQYQIGKYNAEVLIDIIGGEDKVYKKDDITFKYEHVITPIPDSIKPMRDKWIAEEEAKNSELWNGPAIRLHNFKLNIDPTSNNEKERPILFFRPTCWYDYVVTNRKIDEPILIDNKKTTIRKIYANTQRLSESKRVDWIELTNILTISGVVITEDLYTVIGLRTTKVDNSLGQIQASFAETMHRWLDEPSNPNDEWSAPNSSVYPDEKKIYFDYQPKACPNPFNTVIRGVKEEIAKEIAASINIEDISFLSLAWTMDYFNPHLFALIPLKLKVKELKNHLKASRALGKWEVSTETIKFDPFDNQLQKCLGDPRWAQISKAAFLKALVQVHSYDKVYSAFKE